MNSLFDMSIPELFKFALRLIAAAGGFVVGYLVAGPVAAGLVRAAFHKPIPRSLGTCAKLGGGLLLAAIVFIYMPIGSGGGGGGGTGGGTGSGKGPFKGGTGNGATAAPGKGSSESGTGKDKPANTSEILVIEMLGPTTAEGDKFYLLHRKGPAVNFEGVEAYWKMHREQWSRVEVVLTRTSTSENDPAVVRLRQMVLNSDDNKKRSFVIDDGSAK
ncbi:MAG TPA: hypothetical protein VE988_22510 [Gemmataceae bacterium]|nr:hypothetical protein [Gemmataceae bacterium]